MAPRSKLEKVVAIFEQKASDLRIELAHTERTLEALKRGDEAITAPKPRTRKAKAPDVPGSQP